MQQRMKGRENMIRERYNNDLQLIVDANSLKLTDKTQVVIYREGKWDDEIAIDLEDQAEKFEELKPYLLFISQNLCKMDIIVQKYSALHDSNKFADGYVVAYILLDMPDGIIVGYYGTKENTEFDVVFEHVNNELILKSFGMQKNIPANWDKE